MSIFLNVSQCEKAYLPIDSNFEGSFTSFNLVQFWKALSPIDLILSGKVIFSTAKPLKAPSPIDVVLYSLPLIK